MKIPKLPIRLPPKTSLRLPAGSAVKPILRRTAATGVAIVTSASVVLGGMFHSPSALPEQETLIPPPPIILDEDELDGDGKDKQKTAPAPEPEPEPEASAEIEAEPALPEEEKRGLRRWWLSLSLRQRLLLVPVAALLCWGVFGLASAFLPGLLGRIAAWLMTLAALAGGFIAAEKAVFPDVPVKKLLSSRNFAALAVGVAAFGAADCALALLWEGYGRFAPLLHGLGVCGAFLLAGLRFAAKERREREAAAPSETVEPETPPEEPKALTKEDILALADTVSRKRK